MFVLAHISDTSGFSISSFLTNRFNKLAKHVRSLSSWPSRSDVSIRMTFKSIDKTVNKNVSPENFEKLRFDMHLHKGNGTNARDIRQIGYELHESVQQ